MRRKWCYTENGSQRQGRHGIRFIRNLTHTQLLDNEVSAGCFFCFLDLVVLLLTHRAVSWGITPSPLYATWGGVSVQGPIAP